MTRDDTKSGTIETMAGKADLPQPRKSLSEEQRSHREAMGTPHSGRAAPVPVFRN